MDRIFNISEAGRCARTITAEHLGLHRFEPDEGAKLRMREGNRHEQFIREDLPEHGWKSILPDGAYCDDCGRGGVHVDLDFGSYRFVGHYDDLVRQLKPTYQVHLGEYKAMGRFTWQKMVKIGLDDHRTYSMQVFLYHLATDLPIMYAMKNRDTGQMRVFPYHPWHLNEEDVEERFSVIAQCIADKELADCDKVEGQTDHYTCTELCTLSQLEQMVTEARIE